MGHRPFVLEFVGVAGCGKSTLTKRLIERGERFISGDTLQARRLQNLTFVLRDALALLPLLAHPRFLKDPLSWTEIKLMLYLNGWHELAGRSAAGRLGPTVVVLDQGPIYSLARLGTLDAPLTRGARFSTWRQQVIERWANALDMVIWLDAADEVLWDRIRRRDQAHAVKEASREEAFAYLARYRSEYRRAIDALRECRDVTLLNCDTGAGTPSDVLEQVESAVPTGLEGTPAFVASG